MKISLPCVGLAIFALSGCGRSPEGAADGPASAKGVSSSSAVALASVGTGTAEAPREVKIEVGDSMKFSVTRFEAAAGETIRLLLVNRGSAPKDAMGHNWVLLRAGADATAYANAAVASRATDYLPAALAADVIAHTKLLGGGQKDAVVFTMPTDVTPGTELHFLCTFPAHLQLGMRGVIAVR